MGASHHGEGNSEPEGDRQTELMKRFIAQAEGKAKRAYSEGRINADDQGDLALAVAVDEQKKIVILSFGKPVEWIGFGPRDAVALAKMLIEKARAVSTEPLVLTF